MRTKMRLEAGFVCAKIWAKMIFRPLNFAAHRARLAISGCLAVLCLWQAWTACSRPIEVVPTQGATINTNVNQADPARKDFESMVRGPQRSWLLNNSEEALAPSLMPQPPKPQLTPHEKELLDRRRNWVFMTPEDLTSGEAAEEMLGIKQYDKYGADKYGNEKEPQTALERYYEHLLAGNRGMATNEFDKRDSDSWNKETNAFTGVKRNEENAHPFESPFNSAASEVFHPMRPDTFSDVFGTSGDRTTREEAETMREQKLQETRMENFKQLWNIDQPSAAASASTPSHVAPVSSSFPSAQPVLGTATPSVRSLPTRSGNTQQSSTTSTRTPPPKPNFLMPQRPF